MSKASTGVLLLTFITLVGALGSSAVLLGGLEHNHQAVAVGPAVALPPGCVRPTGGFLVIASGEGYNDSILEGAGPSKPWPVINVTLGQDVDITVCNVDPTQAHGFQVGTYFDKTVESIAPGHVITVSFVADKAGEFPIFCEIFCTIHLFMEYGQLRVT